VEESAGLSAEGSGPQETKESTPAKTGERAIPAEEYDGRVRYQGEQPGSEDADVTLDVPSIKVEELMLEVENLRHRTSMQADLADMVKLNVGVETVIDGAKLELKGVDAQTFLKARLDNVRAILSQALDTIDNNPEILQRVARIAEETAGTGERVLEGAAGAIGDVPEEDTAQDSVSLRSEKTSTDEPDATEAARRKAEEMGLDLSQVEGTGAGGRVLLRDVKQAAKK
jgi:pyruvate/2-oxoglutarate dehydrogenase complex dihydrolipoamide acyltransferase (E2) component